MRVGGSSEGRERPRRASGSEGSERAAALRVPAGGQGDGAARETDEPRTVWGGDRLREYAWG